MIRGAFAAMVKELTGDAFRQTIEKKFAIDLSKAAVMYTVRGFVAAHDGDIHTDSKTKIITVLLYLNDDSWAADGGRLRILRSGTDLEDYVAEVPPNGGTLLVFRRCDHSWHGHHRHAGPRRTLQLNWVTGEDVVAREQARHRLSTRFKKILTFLGLRRAG
jgi:Rps23 Pro-64 3,4-dihydroxylase Tpa1-like proline 4-hydroxylase